MPEPAASAGAVDGLHLETATGQGSFAPATDTQSLSLLASAIAGRTLVVQAECTERSWSDGRHIYLANSGADDAAKSRAVMVQAAMIVAGSLDPRVLVRLTGRRRQRLRYVTLEVQRAVAQLGAVVPSRLNVLVAGLCDVPLSHSAVHSLQRAVAGDEPIPEAPVWLGTIKPGKVILSSTLTTKSTSLEDTNLGPPSREELDDLVDEEESSTSQILKLFTTPFGQNAFSRYLQNLAGMGRTPGLAEGAGSELPVGARRTGQVGLGASRVADGVSIAAFHEQQPAGHLYPEWNCFKQSYRRDWCSVTEYDPRMPEQLPGVDLSPPADPQLRRALARLGSRPEAQPRQEEGDVFDMTSLTEYAVKRRIGSAHGSPRIYEARPANGRDLRVLILLDMTGSTGEAEGVRRVFDEQRCLAGELAEAFADLGDRVALYGFCSWGRTDIQLLRVKNFEERYDSAARSRLATLEPGGFTRFGAVVRHGSQMVRQRAGTSNNLLVVVGDAFPYEDGYEGNYADADSAKAIEEAVGVGVACVGITVHASADLERTEKIWASAPFTCIDEPAHLASEALSLFRRALVTAGASRRLTG